MDIILYDEFKRLIPPLSTEEIQQLEDNILNEGCRDSLVLWQNFLLDGHHRYSICCKHEIPFKVVQIELENRKSAKKWIISNQLGRRNLFPEARIYLIGKFYDESKHTNGGKRINGQSDLKRPYMRTCDIIADEFKVNPDTVVNAGKFTKSLDTIADVHGQEFKNKILTRQIRSTQDELQKLSRLSIEKQKIVIYDAEKTGNIKDALKRVNDYERQNNIDFVRAKFNNTIPDSVKIYNDDFLTINKIKENSIDLIVTSPPYGVNIPYHTFNDNLPYDEYLLFSRRWLTKVFKLAKNDGRLCLNIPVDVNNDGRQSLSADVLSLAKEIGWKYHTTIIWNKNNISRKSAFGSWLSARAPFICAPGELILVLYKNQWHKDSGSQVTDFTSEEFLQWSNALWTIPGESCDFHPCPFPIEISIRCIKLFSYVGDTVLEPFMGTGTTLQASLELGRQGIGVEIDELYCDIAKNRLSETA